MRPKLVLASATCCVALTMSFAGLAMALKPPTQGELEMWDQCREVWFKGQDLTLAEKFQRFKAFKPDRKLSQREKDCILKVADILIDKKAESRWQAALWLGDMGHAYCIPSLLAVLRDKDDKSTVRVRCVRALSYIADQRVVDPLIDALGDDDPDVALNAFEQLNKLFKFGGFELTKIPHPGIGHGQYRPDDLPWRRQLREKYRQWWEKHRGQIKLERGATMWD